MARYHDKVGFLIPQDNQETGLSEPRAVEKTLYGRVLEHSRKWETTDHTNDDLVLANQIAITGNDYAFRYMSAIAYARFMGGWWKVTSIKLKYPEIILTLGGVWNGPTAASRKA